MTRTATWVLVALAVTITSGCGSRSPAGEPPIASRQKLDRNKWRTVSLLLRGRDITAQEWARWRDLPGAEGAIADEILDDPFVSEVVAPRALLRNIGLQPAEQILLKGYELAMARIGTEDVWYLRDKCEPADVVTVNPWWDPSTPMRVCRDSIRADVWQATTARGDKLACDTALVAPTRVPGSTCRCGPNLLRCSVPGLEEQLARAAAEELRATTTEVVRSNRPLSDLFAMNQTTRNRLMERYYARNLAEAQRLADPEPLLRAADAWKADVQTLPRVEHEPGHHAGVLTTPALITSNGDPRQRSRNMFSVLWCTGESAPGALPEHVLSLHTPNLSFTNEGWKELAARPVCTSCHARLDYGMQFFGEHVTQNRGPMHLIPAYRGARGEFFGGGIDDPRGSGPLTAAGFARLATTQPEFAHCMARDVAEFVFGPRITDEVIGQLVAIASPDALRFRDMMRAAVLTFVGCDSCGAGAVALPAVPPTLDALVDEHCTACHGSGGTVLDLEAPLDMARRNLILDHAVFGRMPPTGVLPAEVRQRFLAAALAWIDPHGRRAPVGEGTAAFLAAHADPPPALPLAVAREYLHRQPRGVGYEPPRPLNAIENALDGRDSRFTPSFAAITSLEAYRQCNRNGDPKQRAACVDRALDTIWDLGP